MVLCACVGRGPKEVTNYRRPPQVPWLLDGTNLFSKGPNNHERLSLCERMCSMMVQKLRSSGLVSSNVSAPHARSITLFTLSLKKTGSNISAQVDELCGGSTTPSSTTGAGGGGLGRGPERTVAMVCETIIQYFCSRIIEQISAGGWGIRR